MELELLRSYFPKGTNGTLSLYGTRICDSIELPWLNNQNNTSCIPEGRYGLHKIYTEKFGWHLHLSDVKDRGLVMIHPANDALRELKGCIAPVSILTGEGTGERSVVALEKLLQLTDPVLDKNEKVWITIKSKT